VPPRPAAQPRPPLTKERVVSAAVDLADRDGLDALTMRRLGVELGVQAMSLYKHVSNKDHILDEIVEFVFGRIELPGAGADWKEAMRRRAQSARRVLCRHTWAIGLLESRGATGPASMRYVDSILGCLRAAGFSVPDSAHAFWILDSFVYGHVLQEIRTSVPHHEETTDRAALPAERAGTAGHPYLAEMAEAALRSQFSFNQEFDYGLDLIIDALERIATPAQGRPAAP
jgi:AcrR family transcriptional regulator